MPQFFVYEEYCAKYDIMTRVFSETSRSINLQALEMGVEALANSVIAIDDRTSEGKKGLTVGDLLIKVKPIRIQIAASDTFIAANTTGL